jgi:hypothetical protein
MGFLSNILKPKNFIHMAVNPVGATKAALGNGTSTNDLMPQNIIGFSGGKDHSAIKSDPRLAASNAATDPASANYGGDPNDPAFGSFTKPFDVEEFYKQQDPGYAFRLQQGQQAVQNRNSAGSGALSGAAYKDLIDYNQNEASTEYGHAFDRYQTSQGNIFNRLSSLAQLGQNAAAGVGAQGTQLAGNAGSLYGQAGAAQGAGIVGAGNALADGATNAWLWRSMNSKPVASATNQPIYGSDF